MKFKRNPASVKIRSDSQKFCKYDVVGGRLLSMTIYGTEFIFLGYSIELEKALKPDSWKDTLEQYNEADFETKMVQWFQSPESIKQSVREDCLKKSFVYLLIDPTISENLPGNAKNLEPLEAWKRFLQSIFYVGKGTSSRPYSHLYDAIKIYQRKIKPKSNEPNATLDSPLSKKINETEKLKRINAIWQADKGVICLNVFHNIIGVEAYTREASIIEAIGLDNLTNLKRGEYHGLPKTWPMRDKKQLGTALLYKSFNIYLSEGESQLRPTDIKS